MENKNKFKLVDADGKEIEYEILFTFESNETKKSYIAYTDNSLDENGKIKVYASVYEKEGNDLKLLPITTEEEWMTIQDILAKTVEDKNGSNEQ